MSKVDFGLNTQRNPNSSGTLQRVFRTSRITCLECGICCRDTNKRFGFLLHREDGRVELIRTLAGTNTNIDIVDDERGYRLIFRGNVCGFEREHHVCSIYSDRPFSCRAFPFHVQTVGNIRDGAEIGKRRLVVLSCHCPMVNAIYRDGVTYVTLNDLFEFERNNGVAQIKSLKIPFLSECAIVLLTHADRKQNLTPDDFYWRDERGMLEAIIPVV
jgi:Fe-S-cluster containining protein